MVVGADAVHGREAWHAIAVSAVVEGGVAVMGPEAPQAKSFKTGWQAFWSERRLGGDSVQSIPQVVIENCVGT